MTREWAVKITAPAKRIDLDAQVDLTEKLSIAVSVDSATDTLTARFRVTAPTLRQAADKALKNARAFPAKPTRIEVQDMDDWMAEQRRPRPQNLVGVSETAELLGVTRQRVVQLADRPDFPAPISRLSAGPVWARVSIEAFLKDWQRKPTGRPRKTDLAASDQARRMDEARRMAKAYPYSVDVSIFNVTVNGILTVAISERLDEDLRAMGLGKEKLGAMLADIAERATPIADNPLVYESTVASRLDGPPRRVLIEQFGRNAARMDYAN